MDLVKLLAKLQTIGVTEAEDKKADQDYDKDGEIESEKKEHAGAVDNAIKKAKANEDIENVLRGLKAIHEGDDTLDEVAPPGQEQWIKDRKEEFKKRYGDRWQEVLYATAWKRSKNESVETMTDNINECGGDMSPLGGMQAASQDRYTLNIQRGDKNLNVTTDNPDELVQLMKLAGVMSGAEVSQQAEVEVSEEWANTPDQTNEREPHAYGDIRDWGFKGTGKGKAGLGDRRAAGQSDNPLAEQKMFEEYKKFKSGK